MNIEPLQSFSNGRRIDIMFPEKKGMNYSILKMTPEGEYSITRRADGIKMYTKMLTIIGSSTRKHITDLTGNVGGDTILFGLHFGHVDSIEIDKGNFEALKHNVNAYKLRNVKLYHGDSTKLFHWKTDVLYLDPPWGGPDYKHKESMDLFLGNERIDLFIEDILTQEWRPNYVFLKLPRNYNFARLDNLPNVKDIYKFPIRSFFLVGLVM